MKRIELVYEKLKEIYKDRGISAIELADVLNLSRANVSSDLNKLCQEGKVSKSLGRPVLFTPVQLSGMMGDETSFDRFARENQSLYSAVEQAKAAILYPPKGMHILILGDTGVGKSMFAGLIHRYAIEMDKMGEDSPFITFNCADYVNNPQLLIGQLFGIRKGAYSGAEADKAGLIEKANGGILFLDEVHRLPPEGQEMFFTFMDGGTYRRLGETELERRANVLIVSATTENPGSALLRTFTRRIPMVIRIPGLEERSQEERFHLITRFLRDESARLSKDIMVSINSLRALASYNCQNNIGQLKTDIQLACAKAYADYVSNKKELIKINSTSLPAYIREGLYKEVGHRQIWNKLAVINSRYCIFSGSREEPFFEESTESQNIYDMIDLRISELKVRGMDSEAMERQMERDIEDYFTKYIGYANRKVDISKLENVIEPEIMRAVKELVNLCEERLERPIGERIYYGMAVHISNSIERVRRNKKIINPQLNKIRLEHGREFNIALDCLKIIERVLDVTMPLDEAGFLAMFLAYDGGSLKAEEGKVKIIVIAHGETTATSIADVANRLLGIDGVEGINASLEEKPQQVLTRVKRFIEAMKIKSDILLLVDMGSLTTFGQELEREFDIKTKTISMVSTLHVIEAARRAAMGCTLDEVYRETLNVNTLLESEPVRQRIEGKNVRNLAIVTICTTGEGSAVAIKNFLNGHLQYDSGVLEIISINLVSNENIYARLKSIGSERTLLCIVSSFKLDINTPQFGLNDVLSMRAIKQIQYLIDMETTYIKMGETLENHLKNVDGREVFRDIKKLIGEIEKELKIKLDTDVLIGTALHIGCMIDRIKSGQGTVHFGEKEAYIRGSEGVYNAVKKACGILDKKYEINISDDELCYIMNFVNPDNYL